MKHALRYLSDIDVWLPWRVRGGYTFPYLVVIGLFALVVLVGGVAHTAVSSRPAKPPYSCHRVKAPHALHTEARKLGHTGTWACTYRGDTYVVVVIREPQRHPVTLPPALKGGSLGAV